MIEQRIAHPPLTGWRGPALILTIAAAMFVGSALFSALEGVMGRASSALFIVYGIGVAWYLLNRYVMTVVYTCKGSCLRVCRAYGKYERLMLDVWLNNVKACGTLDAMQRRFPDARVRRAIRKDCPIEPLAVAHAESGKIAILLIQPEAALREVILKAVKA